MEQLSNALNTLITNDNVIDDMLNQIEIESKINLNEKKQEDNENKNAETDDEANANIVQTSKFSGDFVRVLFV